MIIWYIIIPSLHTTITIIGIIIEHDKTVRLRLVRTTLRWIFLDDNDDNWLLMEPLLVKKDVNKAKHMAFAGSYTVVQFLTQA